MRNIALIERVDTTMYALGGTRHFLVLGLVIAALAGCQSHATPGECKARADEVARYIATLDRSPRLVDDNTWATLHLVERADGATPESPNPALVIEADHYVYAGESIANADELGLALHNALMVTRRPVLGLAIDRGASWERIVAAFERAEREGFAEVELYYAAPENPPSAPSTLETSHCDLLAQALDRKNARAIPPAFEACNCRVDFAALEVSAWAVLANHHPIRAVRIELDRAGTIQAHPAKATWSEIAMTLQPATGWLTAR